MKGRSIVALGVTAALAAGATTVATGQGTGGTLGPKAQGTTTFQVRIAVRNFGVHCSNTNNLRRCQRQASPRVGSLSGGSGAVFQGGRRVGTAHFTNIVTQRMRRNSGGELFLATVVLPDGTLTAQGANQGGENAPAIPLSITGGTGEYRGARGFATEQDDPSSTQREFRVNVTFTFIP